MKRAVLVGHSNGTPVVRQVYRLYPERTAGLVVVDGALRSFFSDPAQWERFIAPLRGADYKERAAEFVDGMLTPVKDERKKGHIRSVMLGTPQAVMVGGMEAASDAAIWREDPIGVPVLAVMAKSPFWTAEYEAYVRKLAPEVEYHVIDGISHFVMMDRPGEFDTLVVRWMEKNGW